MIGTGQRLRGLAALVALVVLVVLVPYLLIVWGGNPLPSGSPSDWLSEPLSSDGIVSVLVLVMWAAWAHFVVSVVRELYAARGDRTPRLSSGATSHPLARRLVAAVLLLVGTATVTAQSASAADHHVTPSSVVIDVRAGQGTPAGVPDRVDAHVAVAQPVASDSHSRLGLSYRVQPPHGRHHDSLWDIAERTLGDGKRWTELYDLNKDRVQDDGTRLQDADLIYPGWHLDMPDDATGPGIRGLDEHASTPSSAPSVGAPDTAATSGTDHAGSSTTDTVVPSSSDAPGPTALGAGLGSLGGLVVAGLLFGLRRRRGWDAGPPPRGRGTAVDEQLWLEADTAAAEVADRGLRQLSAHLERPSAPAPVLRSARASRNGLSVTFELAPEQSPPDRWRVLGDGRVWSVGAADLSDHATSAGSYAQLVTVGQDHGEHVLINPGGAAVRFGGDDTAVTESLRAVAVDLATHPWADDLAVVCVAVTDDLAATGPDRMIQVSDVYDLRAEQVAGRSVVVISTSVLPAAAVQWLRERAERVSVLCRARDRAEADVVVESMGRLTSARYGVYAQAARLDAATTALVLERFAAEPERGTPPSPVEGFAGRMLDPSAPSAGTVTILGPVQVSGTGVVEPDRADQTREIITYLALHPGGAHPNVLAGAVWPRGVDEDVFDAAMQRVERFLVAPRDSGEDGSGQDDGRRPVLLHEEGRWRLDLSEVRVDWHVFRAHVSRAPSDADPTERLLLALRLVKSRPLSGLPDGRYGWLASSGLSRDLNVAIAQVAEAAGSRAQDEGRPELAEEALRCGLRGVPAAEPLWQALLRLSAADGAERTRAVADQMYATLRRHGSPLGATATTDALVRELLPAYEVPSRGRTLTA